MEERSPEWITKQEALALTGWPERTLERYLQKNYIARDQRAEPGTRPVTIILLADVQKMLKTKEQVAERAKKPTVLKTVERKPTRDINRHGAANGVVSARVPPPLLPAASPPPHYSALEIKEKVYLTLKEAAYLSGLPKAYLVRALNDGRLNGAKVAGWRILREDILNHRLAGK